MQGKDLTSYWALRAPNALRPTGITEKCSRRAISEDKQNVWLDKPKPTHLTWLDNGVRTEAEYTWMLHVV